MSNLGNLFDAECQHKFVFVISSRQNIIIWAKTKQEAQLIFYKEFPEYVVLRIFEDYTKS